MSIHLALHRAKWWSGPAGSCKFGTAGKDEQSWFLDNAFWDNLTRTSQGLGSPMPCLRGSLLGQMSQLLLLSHQALAATLLHSASESPASHEEWSPLGMSQSPCCLLCPQQPGERPCHGQTPEPAALCLVLDSLRTFVQANAKALHFIPRDHSAASDLGLTGSFPPTFIPFSLPSSLFSLLPWVFAALVPSLKQT